MIILVVEASNTTDMTIDFCQPKWRSEDAHFADVNVYAKIFDFHDSLARKTSAY